MYNTRKKNMSMGRKYIKILTVCCIKEVGFLFSIFIFSLEYSYIMSESMEIDSKTRSFLFLKR